MNRDYWECPWCLYRIEDELYSKAVLDFTCPNCEKKHLSDFRFVTEYRGDK